VKQFTPESLYEHINGRAEFFIAYDVAGLTFASYTRDSLNGPFLELFVYDMRTAANAFGVFSAERSGGGTLLQLGRDAYRLDANCYIWIGRYYIIVMASETSKELQNAGRELAERVVGVLPDSKEEVWGLSALPSENLIPATIKYVKADAMGFDFMKDTYMAQYHKYNTDIKHFLSRQSSEKNAEKVIAKYRQFADQYGKGSAIKVKDGVQLVVCDMEAYMLFSKRAPSWPVRCR
jgi:hypothetical protein